MQFEERRMFRPLYFVEKDIGDIVIVDTAFSRCHKPVVRTECEGGQLNDRVCINLLVPSLSLLKYDLVVQCIHLPAFCRQPEQVRVYTI